MWRADGNGNMKTQLVKISAVQTAKVMAALYFVISFPMILLMAIPVMLGQQAYSVGLLIALPILYTLIGFVFTAIGAWVYNLVAGRIGGFEYTTVVVGEQT